MSRILPLVTILLAACGELGLRRDEPQGSFVDTTSSDSTLAAATPAPRPKARAATPTSRNYPSAEEVMHGPPARRDSQPATSSSRPTPRTDPALQMRSDLERLVRAQEQHWANTGGYAARFQYLGLRYVPNAGVSVVIESATDSGWVGRAVRSGWEGRSCVVWVGKPESQPATERQGLRSARPGVPVCDPL